MRALIRKKKKKTCPCLIHFLRSSFFWMCKYPKNSVTFRLSFWAVFKQRCAFQLDILKIKNKKFQVQYPATYLWWKSGENSIISKYGNQTVNKVSNVKIDLLWALSWSNKKVTKRLILFFSTILYILLLLITQISHRSQEWWAVQKKGVCPPLVSR
jgi:hypothetical protein